MEEACTRSSILYPSILDLRSSQREARMVQSSGFVVQGSGSWFHRLEAS
jgi:hypothetical protein